MRFFFIIFLFLINVTLFSQMLLGDKLIGNTVHEINDDGSTIATTNPFGQFSTSLLEIYDFNSNQWQLRNSQQELEASDFMLDGSGNTIIIGDRNFSNSQSSSAGKVEVYTWDGSNWQQKGNTFSGNANNALFGTNVFINNTGDQINFLSQNLLFTYEWDGSSWQQIGSGLSTSFLSASVIEFDDSGNLFAVAQPVNNTIPVDFDVEIYELQNNNWVQKGNTIVNPLFAVQLYDFVFSLNKFTNRFVLGCGTCSDFNNTAGSILVYEYNNNQWLQKGSIITGDQAFYRLGTDVALDATGNKMIVGQPYCDCFGDNAGEIKIFEYDNTANSWNQTLSIDGELAGNRFGTFVDISDSGDIISAASASFLQQVRVFDVSTLGIAENQLADLSIYPNPAQDLVNIKLDKNVQLSIYSLKGEKVLSNISLESGNNTIDLSHLSSGVYFIKTTTDQATQTKKLIIK